MLCNHTLYPTNLWSIEPAAVLQSHGIKPEFCKTIPRLNFGILLTCVLARSTLDCIKILGQMSGYSLRVTGQLCCAFILPATVPIVRFYHAGLGWSKWDKSVVLFL